MMATALGTRRGERRNLAGGRGEGQERCQGLPRPHPPTPSPLRQFNAALTPQGEALLRSEWECKSLPGEGLSGGGLDIAGSEVTSPTDSGSSPDAAASASTNHKPAVHTLTNMESTETDAVSTIANHKLSGHTTVATPPTSAVAASTKPNPAIGETAIVATANHNPDSDVLTVTKPTNDLPSIDIAGKDAGESTDTLAPTLNNRTPATATTRRTGRDNRRPASANQSRHAVNAVNATNGEPAPFAVTKPNSREAITGAAAVPGTANVKATGDVAVTPPYSDGANTDNAVTKSNTPKSSTGVAAVTPVGAKHGTPLLRTSRLSPLLMYVLARARWGCQSEGEGKLRRMLSVRWRIELSLCFV